MTSKQIEPATDEQIAIVQDMDHPLVQSLISRVKIEVAAREELENDVSFWKEHAEKRHRQMENVETLVKSIIGEMAQ